ncbi:TRF2-interacting telomeric protein/Rap1 C terminal domain-containing protein [Aspergillus ambiguus]|uniref:putative transcription factor Rap1 n=1 Tax=Aspergillus ambiguus TaxID=176160 RepID=UPI003CCDFF26
MSDAARSGDASAGSLFEGKTFWLSQRIPKRTWIKEIIQNNGGIIKLQEKDADVKLVDHTMRNLPADSYSYRYVENSVRLGKLQPLELYIAGPSPVRPVGATNIPTRGHKIQYTLADDQALWDWMEPLERNPNTQIQGNRPYQIFAAQNPRHTFQSYRERYLKTLRGRPRPGGPRAPETPREEIESRPAQPAVSETREQSLPPDRKRKQPIDANELQPQEEPKRRALESTSSHSESSLSRPPASEHLSTAPSKRIGRVEPRKKSQNSKDRDAVDPVFLELPFLPSSPEPEELDATIQDAQDNRPWINNCVRTGKAPDMDTAVKSLHCTGFDRPLAEKVLDSWAAGKGTPDDIPGIWTAEDDQCLEADDARAIEKAIKKHGSRRFDARWDYLKLAREFGLQPEAGD